MPVGKRPTLQRLLRALARYHKRVNHPSYGDRRKRGNESTIIELMGAVCGKQCSVCGFIGKTQLHHLDGNWKNNRFKNLAFVCVPCHSAAHQQLKAKEHGMKKISDRNQWLLADATGQAPADILAGYVENHPSGQVTSACRELSANSVEMFGAHFSENQLVNTYYRLRRVANKRNAKSIAPSRSRAVNVTYSNALSADEAVDFWQFCKKMGIKIN